jgi:DNA repair exonuclease SbcCD ATPase subunit
MFHTLKMENALVHRDRTITFDRGLTCITGRNEAGKSLTLEMMRFALHGTAALRDKAEALKGAKITLSFTARGQDYEVVRTTSTAKLSRGGEVIATGTKPVNLKMAELFGYGLDVFDVANCANQGMIEALSSMRAGDRKRLVDSTIGLSVLDDLAKWAGEEALTASREATAIERAMPEIVSEPSPPSRMASIDDLQAEVRTLNAASVRKLEIERFLANEPLAPGLVPQCDEPRALSELEALRVQREGVRIALDRAQKSIKPIPTYNDTPDGWLNLTREQLLDHKAVLKAEAYIRSQTQPGFDHALLDQQEALCDQHHAWKRWSDLRAKGTHTCPSCTHSWPVEAGAMAELGDWEGKPVPEPKMTRAQIQAARRALSAWDMQVAEYERCALLVAEANLSGKRLDMNATQADMLLDRLAAEEANAPIRAQVRELDLKLRAIPAVDSALTMRREYEIQLARWEKLDQQHKEWHQKAPALRDELVLLGDPAAKIEELTTLIVEIRTYHAALAAYEKASAKRAELETKLAEVKLQAEQYKLVKEALVEVKARVKGHLVPSLSRAASILLSRMTGGARTQIEVDEDFDILVDGQGVDTLSGSAKAAANLALRIGLGQVLTNQVFSVFMADEIDAAMDADRAGFTSEALRSLIPGISQIILVSHKRHEADNYIHLE